MPEGDEVLRLLGVSDSHDAGVALFVDGLLVGAATQERFDRRKNSTMFPTEALRSVLASAGLGPADVDQVAIGSCFTPPALARLAPAHRPGAVYEDDQFRYLLHLYIQASVWGRRTGAIRLDVAASRALLRHRLAALGVHAPLVMVDHHTAHAEAAYRTQPQDQVLILTLDSMGDGVSCGVHEGREGRLRTLWTQSSHAAIANFYGRVTKALGFRSCRHEGKIMGLAARAEAPPALVDHFRRLVAFEGPGFRTKSYLLPDGPDDRFYGRLRNYTREEVASATQKVFEEEVGAWAAWWIARTGLRHVALAGGAFANVRANTRIASLPGVDTLWVCPHMGDGGLALGAAAHVAEPTPRRLDHVFLGPSWTEAALYGILKGAGLAVTRPEDPALEVARLLVAGKVVGRFDGAMEWGPRALGNRSILCRPDTPAVNDWLNKRLRRSEFMPFAPAVLAEEAPGLFLDYESVADAARFMTVCLKCRPDFARRAPGIVHLDGTARPQLVYKAENPGFYAILEHFRALTGLPAIINTSFNLHEEPIVCSPEDAIRAWREARLDALQVGPFLMVAP